MIKDTATIQIIKTPVVVGYEYDKENPIIGSGDSDRPGSTSLDIISIEVNGKDLVFLLESYSNTNDLYNDIKDAVLKSL
jgi:hypothetical protein